MKHRWRDYPDGNWLVQTHKLFNFCPLASPSFVDVDSSFAASAQIHLPGSCGQSTASKDSLIKYIESSNANAYKCKFGCGVLALTVIAVLNRLFHVSAERHYPAVKKARVWSMHMNRDVQDSERVTQNEKHTRAHESMLGSTYFLLQQLSFEIHVQSRRILTKMKPKIAQTVRGNDIVSIIDRLWIHPRAFKFVSHSLSPSIVFVLDSFFPLWGEKLYSESEARPYAYVGKYQ